MRVVLPALSDHVTLSSSSEEEGQATVTKSAPNKGRTRKPLLLRANSPALEVKSASKATSRNPESPTAELKLTTKMLPAELDDVESVVCETAESVIDGGMRERLETSQIEDRVKTEKSKSADGNGNKAGCDGEVEGQNKNLQEYDRSYSPAIVSAESVRLSEIVDMIVLAHESGHF